ncbi:MAG TPA: OmpH family outer membrane protein [Bryobacteraceae bacterium]|nr:OmpH family outer membrane protein [Bryobacteraceae bacterium]
MKQILATSLLTLALGAAALAPHALAQGPVKIPAASPAPSSAPQKVAVIQIQSAIVSTKDGQKAMQDFQASLAPKKAELDKKAAEIRDLQDRLQRGGVAMADAAKADLQHTIDVKTKSYNRETEDAATDADQEQRKLLDELGQKMMKVIDSFAQANGYVVILDVSNPNTPVLYASNSVDITREIIELYDKSNPGPATTTSAKPPSGSPAAAKPAAVAPASAKKQP